MQQPLCELCLQRGHVTAATIADHIQPWRNYNEFMLNPLRSLCKPCHDGLRADNTPGRQRREIGADGYPV
jgi:5-methylcytosine-specific restriction protein A